MLLADVVAVSRAVAATPGRLDKVRLLSEALGAADPDEIRVVVPWLSGDLRQRRTGLGWAAVRDLPSPATSPSLSVAAVDALLDEAAQTSGTGSASRRQAIVTRLFGAATADEQRFLRSLVAGDLRQGALDGVMVDAIARAAAVPLAPVRRAAMLSGSAVAVAVAALGGGEAALRAFRLEVGRPVLPMLAATASSVEAAFAKLGDDDIAVDWKLDGIRVQVHRSDDRVAVFSRSLDDITARVPEIVSAVRTLPVRMAVIDGEALALHPNGRPRPFQETGARTATREAHERVPLSLFAFDLLHLDGEDLLDAPLAVRDARLRSVVPEPLRVPRLVTRSVDDARHVLEETLDRGHEGVVVKATGTAYQAGRRGTGWLKVKPVHTLDLVVLAAEWGNGRRRGWLSNLHLGARDPAGGFVMLGKTFKGMTDEMLAWQTEALQQIEVSRNDWQVFVEPRLVVEVAFDGVQSSTRYPGGVTLRFARVVRYRDDKTATDADTIHTVQGYLPGR